MGETRVNLQHLLEDIRDTYPFPIEEAIVTELVANALDSGASEIRFYTRPPDAGRGAPELAVLDDGRGMTREELHSYHDLAATSKHRGAGIGFAGIGAKLALLLCRKVITETWRGHFQAATEWRLASPRRAPWDEIVGPGLLSAPGTAVVLSLKSARTPLVDPGFLRRALVRHFYPPLDEHFDEILRPLYPLGVRFWIDDRRVTLPAEADGRRYFRVRLGRRKNAVGLGFVAYAQAELDDDHRGIAVATYGKVIKRGWDWLAITPRNPERITGVVEVPELVGILTTNKADFLQDGSSLARYYKYRKAIQSEVDRVLAELGELEPPPPAPEKKMRPLERQLEQVIQEMLPEFPELAPLVGRRRGPPEPAFVRDPASALAGAREEAPELSPDAPGSPGGLAREADTEGSDRGARPPRLLEDATGPERGREDGSRRGKQAKLTIAFTDAPGRPDLGWLVESTIWVNRAHQAYRRAARRGWDPYHVILTVGAVLAAHLEPGRPPHGFLSRFLSLWGTER